MRPINPQCVSVTYALDLNAEFVSPGPSGISYEITSFTGSIDGQYSISGITGSLQDFGSGLIPDDSLIFTLDGQQDWIGWDDLGAGSAYIAMTPTSSGRLAVRHSSLGISLQFLLQNPSTLVFGSIGILLLWMATKRRLGHATSHSIGPLVSSRLLRLKGEQDDPLLQYPCGSTVHVVDVAYQRTGRLHVFVQQYCWRFLVH